MRCRLCLSVFAIFFVSVSCLSTTQAQRAANANPVYQQLRNLLPGSEVVSVKDLELKRDAATFTFRSGSVTFFGDVNGKVTGAAFKGDGHLHITPPTAEERHNLSLQMQTEEFDEDFDQVVMRFTDSTSAELHKAATAKEGADAAYAMAWQDLQAFARHHLHTNVDLRLLEDVLSPAPGGFFLACSAWE